MSKRRHEANNYNVRIHIYDRDKRRCRWCGREVRFRSSTQRYYEYEDVDLFVVGHGIPFSQAPSWDDYDNWFTSCQDCNARQGKSSTPPGPIIPDEVKITNWPNLVPVCIIKDDPPPVEETPPPEDIQFELCVHKETVGAFHCEFLHRCTGFECPNYARFGGLQASLRAMTGRATGIDYDPIARFEEEKGRRENDV
jgi:hypothetical protein